MSFQSSKHRGAVYLPPFKALKSVSSTRDYVLVCCGPEIEELSDVSHYAKLPERQHHRTRYLPPSNALESVSGTSDYATLLDSGYHLARPLCEDEDEFPVSPEVYQFVTQSESQNDANAGLAQHYSGPPPWHETSYTQVQSQEEWIPHYKGRSLLCDSVLSWGTHKSSTYKHLAQVEVEFCKSLMEEKPRNSDVARFVDYLKSVWNYKSESDSASTTANNDPIPLRMRISEEEAFRFNQVIDEFLEDDVRPYVKIPRKYLCKLCGDCHLQAGSSDAHVRDSLPPFDYEQALFQERQMLLKTPSKAGVRRNLFGDKVRVNADISLPNVPSVNMLGLPKEDNKYIGTHCLLKAGDSRSQLTPVNKHNKQVGVSKEGIESSDDEVTVVEKVIVSDIKRIGRPKEDNSDDEVEVMETTVLDPESYLACLNRTPVKIRDLIKRSNNPGLTLALQGWYNGPVYVNKRKEARWIESQNYQRCANGQQPIAYYKNYIECNENDDDCVVVEAPLKKAKIEPIKMAHLAGNKNGHAAEAPQFSSALHGVFEVMEVMQLPPITRSSLKTPTTAPKPTKKYITIERLDQLWDTVKSCRINHYGPSKGNFHTACMMDALTPLHDELVSTGYSPPNLKGLKSLVEDIMYTARTENITHQNTYESRKTLIKNCWANLMLSYEHNHSGLFSLYLREMLYLVAEDKFEKCITI